MQMERRQSGAPFSNQKRPDSSIVSHAIAKRPAACATGPSAQILLPRSESAVTIKRREPLRCSWASYRSHLRALTPRSNIRRLSNLFRPHHMRNAVGCSGYRPKRFTRQGPRCAYGGGGGYRPRVQTISFWGHQLSSASTLLFCRSHYNGRSSLFALRLFIAQLSGGTRLSGLRCYIWPTRSDLQKFRYPRCSRAS
jgi:hypothetical protein